MRTATRRSQRKRTVKDKYPATCPRQITSAIQDFAQEIAGNADLLYVPVRPLSFSVPRMCYKNAFMARDLIGGEPVLGFAIWTTRDLFLTSEHHCVFRASDGELIDVTPDWGGAKQVLFIPTGQEATPENVQEIVLNGVTGQFRVLKDHPLVHRAVAVLTEASVRQHQDANQAIVKGRPQPGGAAERWCSTVRRLEGLIDSYYQQQRQRGEERQQRRKKKLARTARKRARTCK